MNSNGIAFTEAAFLLMVCALADAADFFITVVLLDLFGAGEFIKWAINFFVWATVGLWLTLKGVRTLWWSAGSLAEAIPVINALPLRTVTMVITIERANAQ